MRSRWGEHPVRLAREAGSVTAEFVTIMPAIVLVLGCCLAAVGLASQQLLLTDAAADAARSLSRGDDEARAHAIVASVVDGASLHTVRRGEFVCVELSSPGAGGPLAGIGLTLRASSCALAGGL
ncbi:MAG TPA: TadE family type IV pilus minor pilin [Glaciibacter sp.]|nr:TadE family type IV pilus minor pilin [Glaciibacter sp.]